MGLTDTIVKLLNYQIKANGKHYVIGIDKYDNENFWVDSYNDATQALKIARKKTTEAMKLTTDYSCATVYYAYDPKGRYIGGDTWKDE